jgi:hypothetical protein
MFLDAEPAELSGCWNIVIQADVDVNLATKSIRHDGCGHNSKASVRDIAAILLSWLAKIRI